MKLTRINFLSFKIIDKVNSKFGLKIKEALHINWRAPNLNHGTIIRTAISCGKIPLQKSIEFGMVLKYSATRYKQKTEIFLVTRPPTC